jgi:hypothetical protein
MSSALRAQLAWAAVVVGLAVAAVLRPDVGLALPNPDRARAMELDALLDGLPSDALVVVGFDPDLGTYAELRPTVRVLLDEIVDHGARIALMSFTPEGRALAIAELGRLTREGTAPAVSDLGFTPGAEAALVAAAQGLPAAADGLASELADGIGTADLAVVVGGNDLGPRSWVEQVVPRAPDLPLAAVAPTVLLPELLPYLDSGQLDALLGTVRDGAAYRSLVGQARPDDPGPTPLGVVAGIGVALVVLGDAVARRAARGVRLVLRGREP